MKNHLNKQTEESAAEKMTAREREDDKGGEEEKEDPEIRMTLPGALPPLHGTPGSLITTNSSNNIRAKYGSGKDRFHLMDM